MNWKRYVGAAVLTILTLGGIALAQQEVMIVGADSSNIVRRIQVDNSGRVATSGGTHGACVNSVTSVLNSSTNVPASPSSTRTSLTICNSESGATISCEFDGNAAVLATGIEMDNRDCVVINLSSSVTATCICSAATCDVRVLECP